MSHRCSQSVWHQLGCWCGEMNQMAIAVKYMDLDHVFLLGIIPTDSSCSMVLG